MYYEINMDLQSSICNFEIQEIMKTKSLFIIHLVAKPDF